MLQIEHITKVFNKGKADETIALDDVSLQINKGEFVMIIGSNGSGKTTLLNVLSNFIPANERIITVEDSAELQLGQELLDHGADLVAVADAGVVGFGGDVEFFGLGPIGKVLDLGGEDGVGERD